MTFLVRLASYSILIASLAACEKAAQPSHVVLLSDNPTIAINHALRTDDHTASTQPVSVAAYSQVAITTHTTYLAPTRELSMTSPLEVACNEQPSAGDWINMRNLGGLATIEANMKVRIIPPGAPGLDYVPFVDALTDDGYIGQICTRDLKLQTS